MYVDPKSDFTPLTANELISRSKLDDELCNRIDAIATAKVLGPSVVEDPSCGIRYTGSIYDGHTIQIKPPKTVKPFVVVDGVVYINASMIKECTI